MSLQFGSKFYIYKYKRMCIAKSLNLDQPANWIIYLMIGNNNGKNLESIYHGIYTFIQSSCCR